MKNMRFIIVLLVVLCGQAAIAEVHTVSWMRQAVEPGRIVTLGEQDFVLVRLPMKEFTNGNRYIVEFLTPVFDLGPPVVFFSNITTLHSDEVLTNTVNVSGYPGIIQVRDWRDYTYNSNIGFEDGLKVDAGVLGTVTVKVGDTLLILNAYFTTTQQDLTAVPTEFKASSWASWATFVDPTSLVSHFDNWVDFVRILKVN